MAWDDTKVDVTDDILAADWNAMVTDQKTRGIPGVDDKNGSDCTLTDGVVDRVLTLANTVLTKSVELVVRNGAVLMSGDYTITHLTASSTVKFSINIFDADTIKVIRYG